MVIACAVSVVGVLLMLSKYRTLWCENVSRALRLWPRRKNDCAFLPADNPLLSVRWAEIYMQT